MLLFAIRYPVMLRYFYCRFFFLYRSPVPDPQESRAEESGVDDLNGVVLTANFMACVAYVAAGVSAILDLRFIAINKRRNFIITTVVRLKNNTVLSSISV